MAYRQSRPLSLSLAHRFYSSISHLLCPNFSLSPPASLYFPDPRVISAASLLTLRHIHGDIIPMDGRDYLVGNGPSTMRASVLRESGKKMEVELLQIPKPKAGEALVKVKACGVCHTDLHVAKGDVAFPLPAVLGHEISGELLAYGPHTDPATVARVPVGSKVVGAFIMPCGGCSYCAQGLEDLCSSFFSFNRLKGTLYDGLPRLFLPSGAPVSMYSMGGLADFCVLPATCIAPLPPSFSPSHSSPSSSFSPVPNPSPSLSATPSFPSVAECSVMGCAMFTAYGALRNAGDMRAGESVAVLGVGGVGGSCIQLARAFGGHTIIGVDVSEGKLEMARRMGATHCVNGREEDVVDTIMSITGGLGVDIAVEAIGRPSSLLQSISSVRAGGKAVAVGIAAKGVKVEVDIAHLVRRKITLVGSYGAKARKDLPTVVKMVEKGRVNVSSLITQSHSLEKAGDVYEALDRGEILGRAIIDMDL